MRSGRDVTTRKRTQRGSAMADYPKFSFLIFVFIGRYHQISSNNHTNKLSKKILQSKIEQVFELEVEDYKDASGL